MIFDSNEEQAVFLPKGRPAIEITYKTKAELQQMAGDVERSGAKEYAKLLRSYAKAPPMKKSSNRT